MKDHTYLLCTAYGPKTKTIESCRTDFYYKDYPPPDGYENMSPVVKSDDTRKEWEEYWQREFKDQEFENLKKKMQLGRWHRQ